MVAPLIMAGVSLLGSVLGKKSKKKEEVAQAPPQQNNPALGNALAGNAAPGTVKMEIPVQLAGKVGQLLDQSA